MFEFSKQGIPQGSCLSPIVANILLHDFDIIMNAENNDYNCIRYLDDFVIMARNQGIARKQYSKAEKFLKKYKLNVKKEKTDNGWCRKKNLNFLGVEVCFNTKLTRASKKNRDKLIYDIKKILANKTNNDFPISIFSKINLVNDKLTGWGDTFRYICNDTDSFNKMDKRILCRSGEHV